MRKAIYLLIALLVTGACTNGADHIPNLQGELTLHGLSADKWTYFSFETGETVGQSPFDDAQEDAAWAARSDWDLAICGEYIKTNGGASGNGQGGILRDTQHTFQSLEEAPADGYLPDAVFTVRPDALKD